MKFEATGKSIKSILSEHDRLIIPRFQRDFSWDKRNYEEFLEDILSQISYANDTFIESNYFLGNMIFLGARNDKELEVIDGQQRLTTITILLAAIRNTLKELDNEYASRIATTIQDKYIINDDYGDKIRRLEPKSSFPYFGNTIQSNVADDSEATTEEEEDIKSTFDNFIKFLSLKYFKKRSLFVDNGIEPDNEKYIQALKVLFEQIIACEVVAIYVEDKKYANQLFENINSKGKALSPIDVIKNHIFSLVPESDAGIDNLQLCWQDMKRKISSHTSEANYSRSFDDYFIDYLKVRFPEWKVNKANVYSKFVKEFDTEEKNDQLVKELSKDLDQYLQIINPQEGDFSEQQKKPIYYALQAISRFKGRQVIIPIFAVFLKRKENKSIIKNSDLVDLMQFLANYHFAVFGTDMKFRSNQLTYHFGIFTGKVKTAQNKGDMKDAITYLKEQMLALLPREMFIEQFKKLTFSKKKARGKNLSEYPASFAIRTIENHMSGKNIYDSLSNIEHILDEGETGIQNIGNLVILETQYNDELGRLSRDKRITYQDKRKVYSNSRNRTVLDLLKQYDIFSEADVEKRAIELGKYFINEILM
ncbi:DUF262 domain-containing protein [Lactococcus garvieae]|uniref:DUF262 domain-containing protein n=1 Tax=Lactococcus garvieae TaxID=1363 RepID=UPI00254F7663|nr:DUF262 domain-containing protein [Lactococcus garvieae]